MTLRLRPTRRSLIPLTMIAIGAPAVHAVSLQDDVLSLTPGVHLQVRAQSNDATDADGDEYRIQGGVPGAANDDVDFSLRRARLAMNFTYGAAWRGQLTVNADHVDSLGTNNPNESGKGRAIQLRYAWLERTFTQGEGVSHGLIFGLCHPYNNPSDACMSSSRQLFPNSSATASYLAPRGVGVGYRLSHPWFRIAADVQNNTDGSKDTSTPASANEKEGLYYGIRAEFSFSSEWFIARRAESFLGKEGHGLSLGLSHATNQNAVNDTDTVDLTAYGVDTLLWLDRLCLYGEWRRGTTTTTPYTGDATDVDAQFVVVQAGYAMPLDGLVLEPALRFQRIDTDTADDRQRSVYGDNGESGQAGLQVDVALTCYLHGHDNKLSLAWSHWEAEAGAGTADIIRVQHQLVF